MILSIDKEKIYYYIIFMVWFIADFLAQTMLFERNNIVNSKINGIIDIITLIMLIIVIIFFQSYTISQLALIISIAIPIVISALLSNSFKILSTYIFIVAAQNLNIRRLINDIYKVLLFLIPSTIILCLFGVLEDVTMYRDNMVRHSLGFSHPNVLGIVIFQFVICYIILHNGQKYRQIFMTIFGITFVYLVPNSQTPTLLLAVILFILPIYYFIVDREKVGVLFRYILIAGAIVSNVLCVIFTIIDFSNRPFLALIRGFLSGRFSATRKAYVEYGIKLLGQVVYTSAEERQMIGLQGHLYLDTAYATLLIRYGLIVYIIFSVAYVIMMISQKNNKNDLILILLFVFSIYGITESSIYMIKYNFLLLYASELLYRDYLFVGRNQIEPLQERI